MTEMANENQALEIHTLTSDQYSLFLLFYLNDLIEKLLQLQKYHIQLFFSYIRVPFFYKVYG